MKRQLFYVFDKHTDFVRECIKIGMKSINKDLFVGDFDFDGIIYKTLSVHECYSGWEITVMALPYMNYYQLIDTLQTSKIYDEIVGCLGILLKEHLTGFIEFLSKCPKSDRKIKKIKKFILKELTIRNIYVASMTELLDLCQLK